jgi:hypothetical protein
VWFEMSLGSGRSHEGGDVPVAMLEQERALALWNRSETLRLPVEADVLTLGLPASDDPTLTALDGAPMAHRFGLAGVKWRGTTRRPIELI